MAYSMCACSSSQEEMTSLIDKKQVRHADSAIKRKPLSLALSVRVGQHVVRSGVFQAQWPLKRVNNDTKYAQSERRMVQNSRSADYLTTDLGTFFFYLCHHAVTYD